ncbi:V-type proton ATPase subunit C 1-A [Thelohanellus kitauei]|uniref:V-type proton ATPase subunit C n=1 Tax=Thelohanellus kitauei TaxID=669202 RepID=A0A0C2J4W0_THEKT|nr:V-type proton ATPase subunit C 1-A [Thelohanellus kitauei]
MQTFDNKTDKDCESLTVHEESIDDFVKCFKWDFAKYPTKQSPKNLVESIIKLVSQVDADLKNRNIHFKNVDSALAQVQKKNSGSLMVRSLNDIVKSDDFVLNSQYLVTLLVVVSKANFKRWWSMYETLTTWVVPRSSKMIYEDNDSGLMTVIVIKKFVDEFREKSRQNNFLVREYEFDDELIKREKKEFARLQTEKERTFAIYTKWLKANFSDVFNGWCHIKAIRVFVESVLRYGLPVSFQAMLLEPLHKNHKKIREILKQMYGQMERKGIEITPEDFKNDNLASDALSLIDHGEYYPYVSFTMKTVLGESFNYT